MNETGEFRRHWRPLLASFIGMGSGLSLNSYILSIFAPYLIESFGWTRAQWAALGVIQMLIMLCLPVAGRLTDLFGVRRIAAIGALSFPVFLVLIATMDGSIATYAAIYVAQTVICSTTTSTVYSRVVAQAFKLRRGLALGICGSAPPVVGALAAAPLTAFAASHGWQSGYFLIAGFCAAGAIATLLLLPGDGATPVSEPSVARTPASGVYRTIFAMPAFWVMLAACFLTNLQFTLAASQLKLVVLEQGISDATAALLVAGFALASIVGRVISGLALDRWSGHLVAGVSFGLPAIGLALLATPLDATWIVTAAILLVGFTFGAEGDIIPYLVTRHFGIGVYSTVLGMLSAALGSAIGLGNLILSYALATTGRFDAYLLIAAAGTMIGAVLFFMLGARSHRPEALGGKLD